MVVLLALFAACSAVAAPDAPAACHVEVLARAAYPEGPLCTGDAVFFVDYAADTVWRSRGSLRDVIWRERGCGPAGLAQRDDGTLLLACHDAHALVGLRLPSGAAAATEVWRRPLAFPNDIALDGVGGAYVTSSGPFEPRRPAAGALWYLPPNTAPLRRVLGDVAYANGVAIDAAGGALWLSEHFANRLRRYAIVASGQLDATFAVAPMPTAAHDSAADAALLGPDGLHADADSTLWAAHFAGGRLVHLDARGGELGRLRLVAPFADVTNVCRASPHSLVLTVMGEAGDGRVLQVTCTGGAYYGELTYAHAADAWAHRPAALGQGAAR